MNAPGYEPIRVDARIRALPADLKSNVVRLRAVQEDRKKRSSINPICGCIIRAVRRQRTPVGWGDATCVDNGIRPYHASELTVNEDLNFAERTFADDASRLGEVVNEFIGCV